MESRDNEITIHPLNWIRGEFQSLLHRVMQEPHIRSDYFPSVDVNENEEQYSVEVELPGMDAKEIHIEIHGNQLVIKGERRREKKSDQDRVHRVEIRYGSFYRSLHIPDDVNQEGIIAETKQGVLTIILPKKSQKQPSKRIPIQGHPDA